MKRPPGPGTVRLLARLMRGFPPAVLADVAREHGDVVYLGTGPAGAYLISGANLVFDVLERHDDRFQRVRGERRVSTRLIDGALFASEGEQHADRRRLMEPVMYREAPPAHAATIVEFTDRMTEGWEPGQRIDALDRLERMTAAAMVKVLFGEDVRDPRGAALLAALTKAIGDLNRITLGATGLADRLHLPGTGRFRRSLNEFHSVLDSVARDRRSAGWNGSDVVSMAMRAASQAGIELSPDQARDEALALYRGHQAVGAALSWTWMLLAQHPEAEERFHLELDSVLSGRRPTYRDLAALEFTRRVFGEAIRLYPTAWVLARRTVADHVADGHTIPAGSTVLVSPWIVHRDARFWDQPERFDPDRFSPEAESTRHRGAYLPLGAGPKRCMGMQFLPMEAVLVLATVGREWSLVLPEDHRVEPSPKVTLKPKGGLPVTLERRG